MYDHHTNHYCFIGKFCNLLFDALRAKQGTYAKRFFFNLVPCNTELNDLSKIICLRKFEDSIERILVCNVTEILEEHGIHCLPCACTNDVIYLLQQQL